MQTAGIILAVTPLIRLLLEACGLLKENEKAKKVSQIASGVGFGALSQIVL